MDYGIGNRVLPFKGRTLDLSKRVKVYRNLTRKGRVYSIQQGGLVVGSTDCIMLKEVKFTISKKTQERVRIIKQRNVHAYAVGYIVLDGAMNTTAETLDINDQHLPLLITYNPYSDDYFKVRETSSEYVHEAQLVVFNKFGLSATL
jgi:hypothetical protein